MDWKTIAISMIGSLITGFIGSFCCFVVWVHYGFDERWNAHKEAHRIKEIRKGHKLENEWRREHGQDPLPPLHSSRFKN